MNRKSTVIILAIFLMSIIVVMAGFAFLNGKGGPGGILTNREAAPNDNIVTTKTPLASGIAAAQPRPSNTQSGSRRNDQDNHDVVVKEEIGHVSADYSIIPDKYNTGADESKLVTVSMDDADELAERFGLPFKQAKESLMVINFYSKRTLTGEINIENIDFSDFAVRIYNAPLCEKPLKIIFSNCKFGGFTSSGLKDESELVQFEFKNCSFQSISASNCHFYNCYIGGGQSDGIRAFNNVYVIDCYIADKSMSYADVSTGNHTDGTQIYGVTGGTCGNIHFENCRFELPQLKNSTAYINACLMLQIEYCDADDITFKDCIISGGGYSIYAWSKRGTYNLTNASFTNISVGCMRKWGLIYPTVGEGVKFKNVEDTTTAYASSVWTGNGKTHIILSNDTNEHKTVAIYTDKGEKLVSLQPCPSHSEVTEDMTFADFPFDYDYSLDYEAEWVVCYEITGEKETLIRHYNPKKITLYRTGAGEVVTE